MDVNQTSLGDYFTKCVVLSYVQLSVTPWTAAHQAPLSMGFSRQEHWSGLPCPPPGDLPDPGIEPRSPALQVILYQLSLLGSPFQYYIHTHTHTHTHTHIKSVCCTPETNTMLCVSYISIFKK